MPRTIITSKSGIVVAQAAGGGANVILDTAAFTIEVLAAMNGQEAYSALQDYWKATAGMPKYPFPIFPIDETAGKYYVGYDGTLYNAWTWKNAASKKNLASIGWRQYNVDGSVAEEWFGVSTPPGAVADTDQPYYQLALADAPTNFAFAGVVNEPVQVYGDATHGNFDKRGVFELYVRPAARTFSHANLTSVSRGATGPYAQAFPLESKPDTNVTLNDSVFGSAPYTNVALTFYSTPQTVNIGATVLNYNIKVDNTVAGLTNAQLYQYLQYLSRQSTNINQGAAPNNASKIGKTTGVLAGFVGTTLVTSQGVYIAGVNAADINATQFTDLNSGSAVTYPYTASGEIQFNQLIQAAGAGASYFLYFTSGFGTAGAIIVNDANGNPITGSVNGQSAIDFTIAYDTNNQGGRTPGADLDCQLVVIGPGHFKYLRVPVLIKRAAGQTYPANGQLDSVWLSA